MRLAGCTAESIYGWKTERGSIPWAALGVEHGYQAVNCFVFVCRLFSTSQLQTKKIRRLQSKASGQMAKV